MSTQLCSRSTCLINVSIQTTTDAWHYSDKLLHSSCTPKQKTSLAHMLCRLRDIVDSFPYYQRRKRTGRPPVPEREVMICNLVRQVFNRTYECAVQIVGILSRFFHMEKVPSAKTVAQKSATRRWRRLLRRFNAHVASLAPRHDAIIATDATGFGNRMRAWNGTPHVVRALEPWVKLSAAVDVGSMMIASYHTSDSKEHDSTHFERVWKGIPSSFRPTESLADKAYSSAKCADVATMHGAMPYHGVKEWAVCVPEPEDAYQEMVLRYWCDRTSYQEALSKRSLVETAFHMMKSSCGYRLRCRKWNARVNEVQAKIAVHNIRMLVRNDW